MKRLILTAVLAVCFGGQISAHEFKRAETFLDVWAGSCTVQTGNALGTGQFNGVDREENKAVITTNYHVVTTHKNVTLHFLTNGRLESVPGVVRRRAYDETAPVDVAQIYVEVDALARINPPYLPYAGRGESPAVGDVIASSGCPRGTFPKAWRGTILNYYNGKTAVFTPAPEPGQSGSAIVSIYDDGMPYQTGILTWLFTNSKTGGAIPIKNVYDAFEGRRATGEGGASFPIDATLCKLQINDPTESLIGDPDEYEQAYNNYKWFAPIVDDNADMSFLDDNDKAWRNRRRQKPEQYERDEAPKNDKSTGIIGGTTSRSLIERATDEFIKRAENEIVSKAKEKAPKYIGIALLCAILAGVVANILSRFVFRFFEYFKLSDDEPSEKTTTKTRTNKETK